MGPSDILSQGPKKAKTAAAAAAPEGSRTPGSAKKGAGNKAAGNKSGVPIGRARRGDGEVLAVEAVVAKKRDQGDTQYLVEWQEEPWLGERSWVRAAHLNCPDLVEVFESGGVKSKRLLKSITGAKASLLSLSF